jgi:hypothetical protein
VAAGWYADPSNPAQQRWWDGTQWTEQVSAPAAAAYVAGEQQKAPAGTSGNTPWIWIVVFLPLLGLIPLFFIDFASLIDDSIRYASDPAGMTSAMIAFYTQPAIILTFVLSFVVMVGTIVFSYLDWRELKRRGVPQPFHWAFSFLAIAGWGIVYPIGRAVVAKRRTGSGNGVLLAVILTIVLSFIVAIVFTVLLANYSISVVGSY